MKKNSIATFAAPVAYKNTSRTHHSSTVNEIPFDIFIKFLASEILMSTNILFLLDSD